MDEGQASRLLRNSSAHPPRSVAPVPRRAKHLLFSRNVSSPRRKNKSLCENQKQSYISSVPRFLRRAFRDRYDTWRGMRWTGIGRKACGRARTVKPRGPDPPTLGSSLVDHRSMRRQRLISPVLWGERGVSRQTLRRECRMFRPTCSDYARTLCFFSRARLRVRPAPGIPCALSSQEGHQVAELGRIPAARRRSRVKKFHCRPGQASALRRASAVK
jgi:hypothetical protein